MMGRLLLALFVCTIWLAGLYGPNRPGPVTIILLYTLIMACDRFFLPKQDNTCNN